MIPLVKLLTPIRKSNYSQNIFFVYEEKSKYYGSTVMRGQQLSDIAKRALPDHINVLYLPYSPKLKNSYLVLTKWLISTLSLDEILELKKRGNRLFFDPVDMLVQEDKFECADTLIAVSETAFLEYKKLFPNKRIVIVDHHVDPKISYIKNSGEFGKLHTGYFGELTNTIKTKTISTFVDFISIDNSIQDTVWMKKLPNYNFHYAVRNRDNDRHKPFLKGFVAAQCSSNVIVQRQHETIRWLGEDYPYLLKEGDSETAILNKLRQARDSYGSKEWLLGLERMEYIRQQITPEVIGKQLQDVFS